MDFIDKRIQTYADQYSSSEPEHLQKLNRYTHNSVLKPRMLSGHFQGRFLSMMSHLVQAQYILDIGTYTGYSALCLAEGLSDDGLVYTIDNNDEIMPIAEKFINESPYKQKIITVTGDAISEIKKLNQLVPHWDIVWIDAEKSEYQTYFNLCIDKVRKGGLLMADNVLWSGKVLEEEHLKKDRDTADLHAFNNFISRDQRLEKVLMPIRDGIMMMRKK